MATRQKTIEFNVEVDTTSLPIATARDKTVTVHIPETVVAWKSCVLLCSYRSDNTVAANHGTGTLRLQIGAGTLATLNMLTVPPNNSGEHEGWVIGADFVNTFTADWTGTSQVVTVGVQIATQITANHDFKLLLTYDYDDTAVTQIKTVRIPIESTRQSLTAAMQTIGGATAVPALTGGFLPENGVVIRNVVAELWAQEQTLAATDHSLMVSFAGGAEVEGWRAESALISAVWATTKLDISSLDFSAERSIEARSTVTNRYNQLGGMIVVTYEFNASTSTTIMNSLLLGGVDTAGYLGGTTAADQDMWARDIWIQEPGPITLQRSGVCFFLNDPVSVSAVVAVGAQAEQTYTCVMGTLQCGQYSFVHRIDAGGQVGTDGITLQRGRSQYALRFRTNTNLAGWNLSGFLILNYTSGKHSNGVGVHSHSVRQHLERNSNSTADMTANATAIMDVPDTNWFLVSALVHIFGSTAANATGSQIAQLERAAGEGEGDGWEAFYVGTYRSDAENQVMTIWGAARKAWNRWPGDPDEDRYDPELARRFRLDSQPTAFFGWGFWCTYHSITYPVSGTINGYSGDGSGIEVGLYRAATRELVLELTTVAGGTFSTDWYDDTEELFAEAYMDATHVGRSANGLAG